MLHSKKSPLEVAKHNSNPFDSDDDLDTKKNNLFSQKPSSQPSTQETPNSNTNPFDDGGDQGRGAVPSSSKLSWSERNKYKNDFRDSGGLENQSVQELETYAVYKAEETTNTVDNCLKIAADIREDATKTLIALHHQGDQITRTHMVAADIDHDLSRGEKLLGSLGGMFSKTWKPKKTNPITGPVITGDNLVRSKGNHLVQREKLGLNRAGKGQSTTQTPVPVPEPTDVVQKVEVEKRKQDDKLSDLSNILDELKDMAVDMGSEMDRQQPALDHFHDDVQVLDDRVLDARRRGQRLLRK